jgi:CDP-diacylglycerol--serine O-phosphatidyltransferase
MFLFLVKQRLQIIFAVLKFIKNNIPNAITSLNLFLGVLGIYFAFQFQLVAAAYCVVFAGVADFFDGMVARLLKSDTKIGKDLDSLADVVSFGVTPVFIYVNLYRIDWVDKTNDLHLAIIPIFFIAVFSAIRLAIFNNDTRQTTSFIGLPTPANGIMIASFAFITTYSPALFPQFLLSPLGILLFSALSCFMLVMPVPLFALKFKQWSFKGNEVRYIFLLTAAILLVVLQFVAIPLIIILYIVLSIILNFAKK